MSQRRISMERFNRQAMQKYVDYLRLGGIKKKLFEDAAVTARHQGGLGDGLDKLD